jgi:hypothetical protein
MLSTQDLRRCLFAVIELRAARLRGQFVGVSWSDEMITKLVNELASERHSGRGDLPSLTHDHSDRIGTVQAAAMTGWSVRTVQRRYKLLGGQKIGNSIMFHTSAIREHIGGAA